MTKTTGINLGGSVCWEERGKSADYSGEPFFLYTRDRRSQTIDFECMTLSLTGLFKRRLGSAMYPLDKLDEDVTMTVSLPMASDDISSATLDVQLRWHPFVRDEDDSILLAIHDVTAAGLKEISLNSYKRPGKMSQAELFEFLRVSGLRTDGSTAEMVARAEAALEVRQGQAYDLITSLTGVLGKNSTAVVSSAMKNVGSIFNAGKGMLKGDALGALQLAVKAASTEIPWIKEIQKGNLTGLLQTTGIQPLPWSEDGQKKLQDVFSSAGEKAQRVAMAKIADGMELTSLDEGSAWKMLGDAAKSSSRVKSNLEFCCLIENPKTDTQVTIYRDPRAHKVWVAFRGTEQTKWKDVVIDMMINPRALELASSPDAPLRGTIRVSDIKVKGLDSGSCFMRLKLGKKKAVQHNLVEGDELRFGAASKQDEQCIGEEGDYTEEASANIRNIRYKSMRFLFQSWENS